MNGIIELFYYVYFILVSNWIQFVFEGRVQSFGLESFDQLRRFFREKYNYELILISMRRNEREMGVLGQ